MKMMCVAAATCSLTRHSRCAIAPASSGWPRSPSLISMPSNLSPPLRAKRVASSPWDSPRMLTAKRPAAAIAWPVDDSRFMHTSSIGGSSASDVTALAVVPCRRSSCAVVTTVTPLAKWPMTSRNSSDVRRLCRAVSVPRTAARIVSSYKISGRGGMRGLADRVAVVTGGASGIGRAVAERLSEEGSKVVVVDRHGDAAAEVVGGLGGEGLAVQADVSRPEDVDAYMAAARERFGRVDLHHLNAGISGSFAPMAELSPEDFDEVIGVNLRGIFLGIRAALIDFTAEPRPGAIVTTASLAGVQGGGVASPYVAAKHGVIGLTKSAAMNGARLGVRVNTIAPGVIATPLMAFLEEGSAGEGPDMRAFLENLVPLGRLGESSEVASLVAFLLSDEASYLTGNTILIDGGINVDNHTLRLEPPG